MDAEYALITAFLCALIAALAVLATSAWMGATIKQECGTMGQTMIGATHITCEIQKARK